MPQIILASASPRRRELLAQIGIRYSVMPANLDETVFAEEAPLAYVKRIAAEKSAWVFARNQTNLPVLAADTTVVCDDLILGKPEQEAQAVDMLLRLSGRTHQVYTAVSLQAHTGHWQAVSCTEVTFRKLTLTEISAYWKTGEPLDKAGGYAIQGLAGAFVVAIQGSFSGVVGLPVFETARLLENVGIKIVHD
jgi:septum formation protein